MEFHLLCLHQRRVMINVIAFLAALAVTLSVPVILLTWINKRYPKQ